MSTGISFSQLRDYLSFVSLQASKALPAPYANVAHYAGMSADRISEELTKLYASMGVSRQVGWGLERRFLRSEGAPLSLDQDVQETTGRTYPASAYTSVHPRLGRANYKAYVHWLGDQTGKALDNQLTPSWEHLSDSGIRQALLRLYAESGLAPDAVRKAEAAFVEQFRGQADRTDPALATSAAPPQPTVQSVAAPEQQFTERTSKPARKGAKRHRLVSVCIVAALLCLGGAWIGIKYNTYKNLPRIYALADNIAVHAEPSDGSRTVARMDLFGEVRDEHGGNRPTYARFKTAAQTLDNGYYTVLSKEGFMGWLLHGSKDCWYVHQAFVTTELSSYAADTALFANLRGNANELNKLSFAVRRVIAFAAAQKQFVLAASCSVQKTLSKSAPLSVFKYSNRETNELIVIVQATDGQCYYLRGPRGDTPRKIVSPIVKDDRPLPAGGVFSFVDGACTFRICNDSTSFVAKYPFIEFQRVAASGASLYTNRPNN